MATCNGTHWINNSVPEKGNKSADCKRVLHNSLLFAVMPYREYATAEPDEMIPNQKSSADERRENNLVHCGAVNSKQIGYTSHRASIFIDDHFQRRSAIDALVSNNALGTAMISKVSTSNRCDCSALLFVCFGA
jgi:hypothetical protein